MQEGTHVDNAILAGGMGSVCRAPHRLPTCSGRGYAQLCWRSVMCWAARLSPRRLCQVPLHAPCAPGPGQPWWWTSPTTPHVPGFKFSRASYLLSLLRPQIYADLELQVLAPTLCWTADSSQHANRGTLLPGCPCRVGGHPCLSAAWSEGAATRPPLLHPTAGGQEPSSLPSAGT